ncbi:MAG: efflux RND transporter periplasmic adaptor subunit, partial [Candidatus Hydrogenedentes bacterium]|nr:efflux RND transporter periplasmic adaptor subunit [Candidatus Hydrogenedentota bacterium]
MMRQKSGDDSDKPKIVIPVEAQLPKRGDISAYIETFSRVEAENRVDVTPESPEKCVQVLVEEGDRVKAGQALAELDKRDLAAQILENETQLRKQQVDYERAKQMFEEGLGAEVDYDNARFAYEQGQASLKRLKLQYENLTIRSPIDGIVTMKAIQVGQLVSSGSPVFRVVDPNSYMLVIQPPEQELPHLRVGQEAEVTLDSRKGEEFSARVRRINPNVEESGTVKVTLDFDKADMARLRDTAFARVRLVMETHEQALLVPKDAIVEENARKYLFVVDEPGAEEAEGEEAGGEEAGGEEAGGEASGDTAASEAGGDGEAADDASAGEGAPSGDEDPIHIAKRVEIQSGLEDSNYVEILAGIDDDSMIITLGQQALKPGAEVRVTTAEDELQARAGLTADEALKAAEEKRAAGAKTVVRTR